MTVYLFQHSDDYESPHEMHIFESFQTAKNYALSFGYHEEYQETEDFLDCSGNGRSIQVIPYDVLKAIPAKQKV